MSDIVAPIPFLFNRIPSVFIEWVPEDEGEDDDYYDDMDESED